MSGQWGSYSNAAQVHVCITVHAKFSIEGGKGAERPLPTTTKKTTKKHNKTKKRGGGKKPPDTISEHLEFKIFLGGHAPRPPYIGGLRPHTPPPPPPPPPPPHSSDSLWRTLSTCIAQAMLRPG